MIVLVGKVTDGNHVRLSGSIVSEISLLGSLSPSVVLQGSIVVPEVVGEATEYYAGDYEVTPRAKSSVVLNTEKKIMKQDVVIKKIPYYETSNASGGTTVYIASSSK